MVTLFIEETLLAIGKPIYDKIAKELETKYHCYFPDCYDHPEYLRDILHELFGDSSRTIIEPIIRKMDEFRGLKNIAHFIEVLNQ